MCLISHAQSLHVIFFNKKTSFHSQCQVISLLLIIIHRRDNPKQQSNNTYNFQASSSLHCCPPVGFPPSKIIFWTEIKQGSCASQLQGRHDGNQCVILFIGDPQLLQHQFRQVQLGTERKKM